MLSVTHSAVEKGRDVFIHYSDGVQCAEEQQFMSAVVSTTETEAAVRQFSFLFRLPDSS